MRQHTANGTRKYLIAGEREALLHEADLESITICGMVG